MSDGWDEIVTASQLRKTRKQQAQKPKRKKSNTENKVQKAILDYLQMRPDTHGIRINSGSFKMPHGGWFHAAPAGTADILGYVTVNGVAVFLAVEVKAGNNKPTEAQYRFLNEVNEAGGIGFWANSIEMVEDELKAGIAGCQYLMTGVI